MLAHTLLLTSLLAFTLAPASGYLPTYPDSIKHNEYFEYCHPTYGHGIYRLVYNSSLADIDEGKMAVFAAGSAINVLESTTVLPKGQVAGLVVDAGGIPSLHYGYVLVSGIGLGTADAAITAETMVCLADASGAHGCVDDVACAAAGQANDYFAFCLDTAANPADRVRLRIMLL